MLIEKVLTDQGLFFKDSGSDLLIRCLNPEHSDNTPSLRVDKSSGVMHCFSCGFKGDLLNFFNIELNIVDKRVFETKKKIAELERARLGISLPPNTIPIMRREFRGIPKKVFDNYSAFTHPSFGDRLCVPVYDELGIPRYLITRSLAPDCPKKYRYLTYPGKHKSTMLYPQDIKPVDNSIIYVEGVFDMFSLARSGARNVQCLQGVGAINNKNAQEKLAYLDIKSINKVYLMLDNDKAGKDGAEQLQRLIRLHSNATPVIVTYPGSDPGDLSEKQVVGLYKHLYGEDYEQKIQNSYST